jgi:hypothetical protein
MLKNDKHGFKLKWLAKTIGITKMNNAIFHVIVFRFDLSILV